MLKWTSEPPKETGWYWHRPEPGVIPKMVFVYWRYAPNQEPQWCAVLPCNCDVWRNINEIAGEWAGPIPEPEEEDGH